MFVRMVWIVASLGLLALRGDSCDVIEPKTETKTTVIFMRHCFRSTEQGGIEAVPAKRDFDQYSSEVWPKFPVPAEHCLPRGERLITGQGRWLRANGGLPLPLRAIADDIPRGQRDNVTMTRLLEGLELPTGSVSTILDAAPFRPALSEACHTKGPSTEEMQAALQTRFKAGAVSGTYMKRMHQLSSILGEGEAGNWTNGPCTARWPNVGPIPVPVGPCQAAFSFAERLLMEWGGGMPTGWGRVALEDIPKLFELYTWYFKTWWATPEILRLYGASQIRALLGDLREPRAGTTLYVGHDNDLMMLAGALGLSWENSPFPDDATIPGSMLRFDLEGNEVTASFSYVADVDADDGSMRTVPARFSATVSERAPLETITALLERGSAEACARKFREPCVGVTAAVPLVV